MSKSVKGLSRSGLEHLLNDYGDKIVDLTVKLLPETERYSPFPKIRVVEVGGRIKPIGAFSTDIDVPMGLFLTLEEKDRKMHVATYIAGQVYCNFLYRKGVLGPDFSIDKRIEAKLTPNSF